MKAAVIGIGNKGFSGWNLGLYPKELTHVGALLETRNVELVAVADTKGATQERFAEWARRAITVFGHRGPPSVYYDYEKMLTEAKPDIVTIATPVETHMSICRNAMRYDSVKAILLEKPIASTLEEAEKILKSQREFNVPIVVNHTRRWHLAWKLAYKKIRELGHAFIIVGYCNGEPLDAGIHMFDLFNWLGPRAAETYVDLYDPTLGKYQPYLVFEVHAFCPGGRVWIENNGETVNWGILRESSRYRDLKELRRYSTPKGCKHGMPLTRCFNPFACDINAQLGVMAEVRDLALGKRKKPTCSARDGYEALLAYERWEVTG